MSAASTATGRPRLTILSAPLQGRSFIITGQSATIGRNPECEVILDLHSISRQHARISEENGRFVIRDLDSRNGITVAGQSLRESLLQHGDLFTVGDVQFRFEIIGAAAPAGASRGAPSAATPARVTPAIPAGWQPVAPAGGPPVAAPEEGGAAKLNVKLILAAAVGLLLAIGAGALLLSRGGGPVSSVAELPAILVKVGENRWLPLGPLVRDALKRKETPAIEVKGFTATPDKVVQVTRVSEVSDPGELIVTGVSGGEADVRIVTGSGNTILLRVLVRGRVEDSVDVLAYAAIDEPERRASAHYHVESGLAHRKENPYLAQRQFERALALLSKLPRGEDYIRASAGLEDAKREVDARWEKLAGDVRIAANNKDFQRAAQLLGEALKLIPDANDWRNQKAQWFMQQVILQQMPQKK